MGRRLQRPTTSATAGSALAGIIALTAVCASAFGVSGDVAAGVTAPTSTQKVTTAKATGTRPRSTAKTTPGARPRTVTSKPTYITIPGVSPGAKGSIFGPSGHPVTGVPATATPAAAATIAAAKAAATTTPKAASPATAGAPTTSTPPRPTTTPPTTVRGGVTWTQTFADEFTAGLAPEWSVITTGGGVLDDTFGNECYLASHVTVSDGALQLRGEERSVSCPGRTKAYGSGMVTTRSKFSQTYGRFEARMKMPRRAGSWPAWWLMPQESFYGLWPRSGEIDIVEYVSDAPSTVFHTIHWAENGTKVQDAAASQVQGTTDDWHVYALEWEPGELRWYVDDALVKTFRPAAAAPFDRPFYLILNQTVGGEWPGPPEPGFSNTVSVDWVRVWKRS